MALRLFIGIELDEDARASLVRAIDRVRATSVLPSAVRLLAAESWHITLQFLGAVADEQLGPLRAALLAVAARAPSFEAQLSGAGAFPSPRKARVVWTGLAVGAASVAALAREVEQATRALGFSAEEREHHPHATWGRLREPADVRSAIAAFELEQPLSVRSIALFRSHLSQSGARYEVLNRFALSG